MDHSTTAPRGSDTHARHRLVADQPAAQGLRFLGLRCVVLLGCAGATPDEALAALVAAVEGEATARVEAIRAGAGVRRWRARLVTWRCGWDRQCAAVVGAGYAARVLALRARIARAGGVQ